MVNMNAEKKKLTKNFLIMYLSRIESNDAEVLNLSPYKRTESDFDTSRFHAENVFCKICWRASRTNSR